jgi:hypothetical protein
MSTLDAVIQEVLMRIEAAGGKAWLAPDAPEEMKLAFLEALMNCPDCRPIISPGRGH